jgi:HAE1 family hydrophobic/amphiphilic exporter-1
VIINVAVLGLSLLLIPHIGTDYIPDIDAGDVVAIVRLPEGVSTTETERMTERIEKIFTDNVPEIRYGFSVAGQTEKGILSSIGFSEGKNISTIAYHLCPPDERERSAQEIAAIITNKLNEIPEIDEFHVTGGSILASGLLGNIKPIEIEIRGNSLVELDQLATVIEDSLKSMPFLINVENSANLNKPEYQILIDRNKANTYGLNTAMIAMQVRQSIYGTNAGTFREQGKEYDIVIRYADEYRKDPSKLNNIMIQTLRGTSIPLSEVATIKPGSGPLEIAHDNQKRIVKVSASLNNISLGEAVSKVQSMVDHVDHTSGTSIVLAGQVNEQQDSFGNMSIIFLIGIMLVFMIMASQFESLKNPFIILFSIPFTLIGVIWAFEITGLTLSVVTFVGIIMLVGIVVNNGIVLVDYINLLIARNNDLNTAISEAGQSRLRPVLMTTFTTILGMIPMALSTGLGSELWSPLGITLIGGLLISTLVTLILMPVLYSLMNSKKLKK